MKMTMTGRVPLLFFTKRARNGESLVKEIKRKSPSSSIPNDFNQVGYSVCSRYECRVDRIRYSIQ